MSCLKFAEDIFCNLDFQFYLAKPKWNHVFLITLPPPPGSRVARWRALAAPGLIYIDVPNV